MENQNGPHRPHGPHGPHGPHRPHGPHGRHGPHGQSVRARPDGSQNAASNLRDAPVALRPSPQVVAREAAGQPPSSEDKHDYRIITLTEENYPGWKLQVKLLLESKNLWQYVSEREQAQNIRGKQAANLTLSSISYDNMLKVINCQTAFEMWRALECIYENKFHTNNK